MDLLSAGNSAIPSGRRQWMAGLLVFSWLTATVCAFWWFEVRNLQRFDRATSGQTVFFDSTEIMRELHGLLSSGAALTGNLNQPVATVLHFWDPSCPCSRFNEAHVRELMTSYRRHGVQFTVVARAGTGLSEDEIARRASSTFGHSVPLLQQSSASPAKVPPSSPATAIFDAGGQLAYFGPYSSGAMCLSGNGAFAEKVLDSLMLGDNPQQLNTLAFGCFCSWTNRA